MSVILFPPFQPVPGRVRDCSLQDGGAGYTTRRQTGPAQGGTGAREQTLQELLQEIRVSSSTSFTSNVTVIGVRDSASPPPP